MAHPKKKCILEWLMENLFLMKNKILYIELMSIEIFKYEPRYRIHIYLVYQIIQVLPVLNKMFLHWLCLI